MIRYITCLLTVGCLSEFPQERAHALTPERIQESQTLSGFNDEGWYVTEPDIIGAAVTECTYTLDRFTLRLESGTEYLFDVDPRNRSIAAFYIGSGGSIQLANDLERDEFEGRTYWFGPDIWIEVSGLQINTDNRAAREVSIMRRDGDHPFVEYASFYLHNSPDRDPVFRVTFDEGETFEPPVASDWIEYTICEQ